MTAPHGLVIGVDVGTTTTKAVAIDALGAVVGAAQSPTRWDVSESGDVQTDIDRFADDAIAVMCRAVAEAPALPVLGIGITGLAETGVVVDQRGHAITPAIAWYDQRGKDHLQELSSELRDSFSAHTGLAFKSECSFAKLLWLRGQGLTLETGDTWLNALEYIAFKLTGVRATEPSLASRTGLFDQGAVAPWSTTLDLIGAPSSFLPRIVPAGETFGHVNEVAPTRLRGAAVTIAGHDHLVGAVGAGAAGNDDLYNSCGTADVVIRSVPRTLSNDERFHLVERGLSAGRHVLSGSTAILGATRSGLVLGRVLSLLGADERAARRVIADAWTPDGIANSAVEVDEPGNWTNEVTVRLRDSAQPSDLWAAAMSYVLGRTNELLMQIDEIAGPYQHAVAAGGWSRLDGVFRGKETIMPGLIRSLVDEPGARGAGLFAGQAAGLDTRAWPITNLESTHHTTEESH